MKTTTRIRTLLATGALAVLLATGACSSGDQADHGGAEPAIADRGDAAVPDGPADERALQEDQVEAGSAAEAPDDAQATHEPREPAVIATGSVALETDDVADARDDVQQITDRRGGSIAEQDTRTGDDGDLVSARLVLRVPTDEFDDTVAELEDVATLTTSTTGSDIVTSEVVDVEARIRAQERSVARVEVLFGEAETIRQIMSIETELARRQAELDSLRSQQKWLQDQTSLATITVHLNRADTDEEDTDEADGFLGGLRAGWDGLVTGLSVALTALGYALPWLALLAVIGVPVWLWLRSTRRPRTAAPADGAVDVTPGGDGG